MCMKEFGPLSEFLLQKKALHPSFDAKNRKNPAFLKSIQILKAFFKFTTNHTKSTKPKTKSKSPHEWHHFSKKNISLNSAFSSTRSPTHCKQVGKCPFRGRYSQLDFLLYWKASNISSIFFSNIFNILAVSSVNNDNKRNLSWKMRFPRSASFWQRLTSDI